jgi:hypothetical protein
MFNPECALRQSERGEPKEGEVTEGNLGSPLFKVASRREDV